MNLVDKSTSSCNIRVGIDVTDVVCQGGRMFVVVDSIATVETNLHVQPTPNQHCRTSRIAALVRAAFCAHLKGNKGKGTYSC